MAAMLGCASAVSTLESIRCFKACEQVMQDCGKQAGANSKHCQAETTKCTDSCLLQAMGNPTDEQTEACADKLYACRDEAGANEESCVAEYNKCWSLKPLPNN